MTREIELSNAPACFVRFQGGGPSLVASWLLPASKTDQLALGVERAHGCGRVPSEVTPGCPSHTLWDQLQTLHDSFFHRFNEQGRPDRDLPLLPDERDTPCTKEQMVATISEAATQLGLPSLSTQGLSQCLEHTLRITGAQGLARSGMDTWMTQLVGRWGSSSVLGYILDSPVEETLRKE